MILLKSSTKSLLIGYRCPISSEDEQPLDQLDLDSPYCSPFHTPVQSQPHTPLRIMANVNANQPPPQLAWRARSPLNLTPPLHDLP